MTEVVIVYGNNHGILKVTINKDEVITNTFKMEKSPESCMSNPSEIQFTGTYDPERSVYGFHNLRFNIVTSNYEIKKIFK